jgi:LPS-assembly lipoprotein
MPEKSSRHTPKRRAKKPLPILAHRGGRRVKVLLLFLGCLSVTHCGFQPRSAAQLPLPLRSIALQSSDPYGPLARALQAELRRHGFTLLELSSHPILQLQLLNATEERTLRSLFADGRGAQYQLIYRVTAQLHWSPPVSPTPSPTQPTPPSNTGERIPLATAVAQSFFENPQAALAKSVEQEIVRQQLCQQAADQLAVQLLLLLSARADSTPISTPLSSSVADHATSDP